MYWPENVGTSTEYGDIIVSLVEVEQFGDYVQRTMKIRHSVNNANTVHRTRSFPTQQFLRASAMLKHVIDIGWTSVCLSVCLSVRPSDAGTVSKRLNILS